MEVWLYAVITRSADDISQVTLSYLVIVNTDWEVCCGWEKLNVPNAIA